MTTGLMRSRDLDPQNVDTLLIQSQAVIDFVVAPGNDVDHQVDDVLPLDGAHAKELCHIDEADWSGGCGP